MTQQIDYYLSPVSPWTYLGHARFAEIAKRHGATVSVKPVDYGVIFPQSGGWRSRRGGRVFIQSKSSTFGFPAPPDAVLQMYIDQAVIRGVDFAARLAASPSMPHIGKVDTQ